LGVRALARWWSTNAGIITSSAAGSLTLGAAGLTNNGLLHKTGTGVLTLAGPLMNAGTVLLDGGVLVFRASPVRVRSA
jgi:hypothetical protein